MAHAQKPDFVFRRNGRVHLNRQGRQFSRLLAAVVCASALVMLDTPSSEVVKRTGYPLHSPLSLSIPLPCVTLCHHVSTVLYTRYASVGVGCDKYIDVSKPVIYYPSLHTVKFVGSPDVAVVSLPLLF